MNDKPNPEQAAANAQKTINKRSHYSGGDPLLDAQIASGERVGIDTADSESIATNLAGNTDIYVPTEAENFTTTGAYPVDATRLEKDCDKPLTSANQ